MPRPRDPAGGLFWGSRSQTSRHAALPLGAGTAGARAQRAGGGAAAGPSPAPAGIDGGTRCFSEGIRPRNATVLPAPVGSACAVAEPVLE